MYAGEENGPLNMCVGSQDGSVWRDSEILVAVACINMTCFCRNCFYGCGQPHAARFWVSRKHCV